MKKLISILLGLCFSLSVFSQKGTIRGFVSSKETGDPIMFCNVTIENTNFGSQTDLNGMYTLSKIPPGEHNIIVTYVGYKKLIKKVVLNKDQIMTLKLELEESTIKIDEIEISAERQEMKTDVKAASIKISNEDLKLIPTIGGEADLAQYLQIIPGVIFTGDQGGQLYIRGGSPIQNKVLTHIKKNLDKIDDSDLILPNTTSQGTTFHNFSTIFYENGKTREDQRPRAQYDRAFGPGGGRGHRDRIHRAAPGREASRRARAPRREAGAHRAPRYQGFAGGSSPSGPREFDCCYRARTGKGKSRGCF